MTKYTNPFLSIISITITIILFFTVLSLAEIVSEPCKTEGHVEFFPEFNKDYLFGVITFSEHRSGDKVMVDGIFATDIGVDGIKTKDGKPRYTAELQDDNGEVLYDLTEPIFNNAIELVSFNRQYANLQICSQTDSIIGKVVVVKRGGNEIARAEIYTLLNAY